MHNDKKIVKLNRQQQAMNLVLQGYSRASICEIMEITRKDLSVLLSATAGELDSELADLRKTFLASAMNRMEDLIQRQFDVLDQMENIPEGTENKFSVRDYNSVVKTTGGLIKQANDMLAGAAKLSEDVIDGVATASNDETTLSEDDPIYQALLDEYLNASPSNGKSILDREEDSPEETAPG